MKPDLRRGLMSWIPGLILCLFLPAGLAAQQANPVTLRRALEIALEKNPQRKAALANTKAAFADVKEAQSALLPHVLFSETVTDGNDPVYVFGSKLRQHRFTNADFDLNFLNTPTPFSNYATRFGGTWDLFDSLQTQHAIRRAERAKDAANHELERANQEVVYRVIDTYYSVVLARERVDVAEQAMKTAQSILDRSQNRVQSGVSVESDYLTAQVRFATRKQELVRAQDGLAIARAQLRVAMGAAAGSSFDPSDTLAERIFPSISLNEAEQQAIKVRPDLLRIRSEEAAQQQGVAVAKASFGPRVNGFADWEMDNPTFAQGGGGNNWTAGIEVQFDIFAGGAKRAELSRQVALQDKMAATREVTEDEIRLEVERTYYDLDAAQQQVSVARASIAEAQESLRINQDRYDAGLLTITDILGAEEEARRTKADYWEALYRYYIDYTGLELARGTLSPLSPVVAP